MVINQTIKHIRAYDNFSKDRRVVLNYTSVGKSTNEDTRSLVDSFYISCLDEGCFLNMNNFQLKNTATISIQHMIDLILKLNISENKVNEKYCLKPNYKMIL